MRSCEVNGALAAGAACGRDEVGFDKIGINEICFDGIGINEVDMDEVGTNDVDIDEVGINEVDFDEVGIDAGDTEIASSLLCARRFERFRSRTAPLYGKRSNNVSGKVEISNGVETRTPLSARDSCSLIERRAACSRLKYIITFRQRIISKEESNNP